MPSIRQSIRSSTASKRPTSAIADGQIALNTASGTPGLFFKDNANNIIKAGPAHYGASAPNSSPAVGGSTGNSIGEAWLDSSLTPAGWKIWNGSAWVNATPLSSDTVQGLVELATNAETQAGVDAARAVTAASLQSKVSDSISTTSASGIASSTAVKTAYDLANAALPKSGGIVTGNLEIGSTGSFTFEGSTADGFETTLAVVDPTADRTITFPNITGTVVTTGDTGTVTSTMILDGTILNADINASAAIVDTKLATIATALKVSNSATTAASANTASAIVARDESGNFTAGTITAALTGAASSNVLKAGDTMTGVLAVTAGTAALPGIAVSGDLNTGIFSPGADQVAISTNGTGRLFIDSSGRLLAGTSTARSNFFGTTLSAVTQTEGIGGAAGRGALSVINNDASNNPPYLLLGRSGAATLGSNTIVVNSSRLGTLTFHGADGTSFIEAATVAGEVDGTPGSNDMPGRLVFSTTSDGAASPTERLRIDSSGRVGIGVSGPQSQLQVLDQIRVSNSAQSQGSIVLGDGSSTAFNVGIARWNGGANAAGAGGIGYFSQGTSNVGGHYFYTGDAAAGSQTARMVINSSGSVGIGTTSPQSSLDVASAPYQSVRTYLSSITDTYHQYRGTPDGTGFEHARVFSGRDTSVHTYGSYLAFYTEGKGSGTTDTSVERLRIDSSGRVGIGTTDIRQRLTFGTTTISATATPECIDLGATFSSTAGANMKILTYNDGTIKHGIGVSTASSDYLTASSGAHVFYRGTTEVVRFDSSSRLLVGTSTYDGNARAVIQGNTTSNTTGALVVRYNGTRPASAGEGIGSIRFESTSQTSSNYHYASISCDTDGASTSDTDIPGRLVFSTTLDGAASPTERMRITNGGAILIGTTSTTGLATGSSANQGLAISTGTIQTQVNNNSNQYWSKATGYTSGDYTAHYVNNTYVGGISTNGSTTSYATSSDYRLKENVTPVPDGITRLQQLKPSRFNFIADPDHTVDGFIAHEAQAVVPECVTGEKDAVDEDGNPKYQGIDQSKLVPLLTAALQEAIAKIEALETRLSALEAA